MNSKRKLTAAAPLFAGVSKQLRSKFPRRKRQRFSPVIIRSRSDTSVNDSVKLKNQCEVDTEKNCCRNEGDVHVELSDCSCVVSNSVIEGSRRNGVLTKESGGTSRLSEGTSNVAGGTSVMESASDSVVAKSGISSLSKLNEGTSNVAGVTTTSMLESGSDRKFGISSLRKLNEGTGNVAGGTTTTSMLESGSDSVVARSGISSLSKLNEGTSIVAGGTTTSMMESVSDSVKQSLNNAKLCDENDEIEVESGVQRSELSGVGFIIDNDIVLSTEETVSFPGTIVAEMDLECSENFSNDCESNSYSSVYSSVYFESSEFESLSEEYSTWFDSGSQFSEKSDPDGVPSHTFQLLSQFRDKFYRSSLVECSSHKLIASDSSDQVTLGLENEEYEENYRMLKSRERKQLYLRDYAAEYCCTGNGQLIIEQRLEMVHWIFEHSANLELQSETMFLGINLLDRFFSKGYFKTKRSLQIAGIACLTLATRIEENQPYNSIRQKTFYVGNTAYSRCEVVAMEWLVQEILNFQCFLPTLYNFLWFYLKAVRANEAVGKTVGYLATLAMLSHEQMCYWPSTVAASLVILACQAAESDAHCHLLIESHGREKDDTLPECIKRLEWLVKYC